MTDSLVRPDAGVATATKPAYDLWLLEPGADGPTVLRLVQTVSHLDGTEARRRVGQAPTVVLREVDFDRAAAARTLLSEAGAHVVIERTHLAAHGAMLAEPGRSLAAQRATRSSSTATGDGWYTIIGSVIILGILTGLVFLIHYLLGSWWGELAVPIALVVVIGLTLCAPHGRRLVTGVMLGLVAAWLLYGLFPHYRALQNHNASSASTIDTPADPAATTPDAQFLLTARTLAPNLTQTSDAGLLAAGHAACTNLGTGDSFSQSLAATAASGFAATDSGIVIGAAVSNFCPQYAAKLPN